MAGQELLEHRQTPAAACTHCQLQAQHLLTGNRAGVLLECPPPGRGGGGEFGIVVTTGLREVFQPGAIAIAYKRFEGFVEADPELPRAEIQQHGAVGFQAQVGGKAIFQFGCREASFLGDLGDLLPGPFLQRLELDLACDAIEHHQRDVGADPGQHAQADHGTFVLRFAGPGPHQRGEFSRGVVGAEQPQTRHCPAVLAGCTRCQPRREQVPTEVG